MKTVLANRRRTGEEILHRSEHIEITVKIALQFLSQAFDALVEFHPYPSLFPSIGLEKQSNYHSKSEGHRYRDRKFAAPVRSPLTPDQNQRGKNQDSDCVPDIPGDPVAQEISRMDNAGDPKRRYPDGSGNDTTCRRDQRKADDFFLGRQGSWNHYKPADEERTCIGLQRGAATDKQRHRERFHDHAERRRLE